MAFIKQDTACVLDLTNNYLVHKTSLSFEFHTSIHTDDLHLVSSQRPTVLRQPLNGL